MTDPSLLNLHTKHNPFNVEHTPILHRWQEAVNLHRSKNLSILDSIKANKFLYPDGSEIQELKIESAELEVVLGTVFDYEYEHYISMYPKKTQIRLNKSFSDLIPTRGIAFGLLAGWYTSVFKGSSDLFRRGIAEKHKKLSLWKFLVIVNTCTLFDLITRLNYVGDEYQRLQFLKWCVEYRKNTALLEFTGTEKYYCEGGTYRNLLHQNLNAYTVIDHYRDILRFTWDDLQNELNEEEVEKEGARENKTETKEGE